MVRAGVEIVVMEVSAHAIAQDRLYGITSDISIFTNVSPEHLDYFAIFAILRYKIVIFQKRNDQKRDSKRGR